MTNWYLISKRIHRIIVFPLVILMLIMSLSGMVLKFPRVLGFAVNPSFASYVHNQVSVFFSALLFGMAITGLVLYLYPIIKKRQSNGS
jgi:cytochrome b subunit of formate dehydrogenase